MKMVEYFEMKSQLGSVGIYFTKDNIIRIALGDERIPFIQENVKPATKLPWPELEEELSNYFLGKPIWKQYPVSMEGYSDWTRKVLTITAAIPHGHLQTYKQVAEKAGVPGGARAVGQALSRNRTPLLIPCHRVVGQNGNLVGFGSGLPWKKGLLELERGDRYALPDSG